MKGFINLLLIFAMAAVSVLASYFYVKYEVNKIEQKTNLGATVYTTQLTDTINTFRNQVNSSTANLNTQLTASTSTDPGHLHTTAGISSTIAVAQGGTATSTLTLNNVILGNGTSAVQFVAPGSNNNVLTSNGTTWTSAAAAVTSSKLFITAYPDVNLSTGQAVYRFSDSSQNQQPSGNFGFRAVTQTTLQGQLAAQSFSLLNTSTISNISLTLCKQNSPSGNVLLSIQGNSATSSPNNNIIVSSTFAGSGLVACNTRNVVNYTFNTTSSFNASTTYWIVFDSTDALSDTNFYGMGSSIADLYTRGKAIFHNGTDWTTSVPAAADIWFDLNLPHIAVRLASGNASTTADAFLGFANSTINALTPGFINITGVTQVTSTEAYLSIGGLYYLSNTSGSVSSSSGTFSKKVGIGLASSTLLITNIW